MTFDADFDDDDLEQEFREEARSRDVQDNVARALSLANDNWRRHSEDAMDELRAILTVLGELAEAQAPEKPPLTVELASLHTAARTILAGVYTEAEVAEDMASFRKLLASGSSPSAKKLVLEKSVTVTAVRDAFVAVFGTVEEELLQELLGALSANSR